MNNGFYYQVILSFLKESSRFNVPRFMKEMNRSGDIENVNTLRKFVQDEILTTALTDTNSVKYFLFQVENAMLFDFYRGDFSGYFDIIDVFHKRYQSFSQLNLQDLDVEGWKKYVEFLDKAARRVMGHVTIEQFEVEIDEIEWTDFGKEFIYRISGIIGYVYLIEKDDAKRNKGRFWLQKAVSESEFDNGFIFFKNLVDFYLSNPTQDNMKRLDQLVGQLIQRADSTPDMLAAKLYKSAIVELQSLINLHRFGYDDDTVKTDIGISAVKELEKSIRQMIGNDDIPAFVKSFLKVEFARHYALLALEVTDPAQAKKLNRYSADHIDDAIMIAGELEDELLLNLHKLTWIEIQGKTGETLTEKEVKDLVQSFKKADHFSLFSHAVTTYAGYYKDLNNNKRAYEVSLDLIRFGKKRIEEGGMQMVNDAFSLISEIFTLESTLPGVSWIVEELDPFFNRVEKLIGELEPIMEEVGSEEFNRFSRIFNDFASASHFNLKVYFRYQLAQVKMLRLLATEREDELSIAIVNTLLGEFANQDNPFSFIDAEWDEFKNVPNSVRNKTLNKCISITKGDLPAAAEHLDFSYRNLRSYITFNEVNRLGNFLEHQETTNKQLEQGIRLMFHDLYKKGTIFEVVFDMPKFLVDFANQGFSSQDMEQALNIKGTTAKKYIKIMMDIELIRQEKSVGRKHFYALRRDNVMTRLGKEQKVLVS